MTSVDQALGRAAAVLAQGGIEQARHEARILLGHVLGASREQLLLGRDETVAGRDLARLLALAERRALREPIAYLTGTREFWGLAFTVTPATLIPRPDSETLIEAALDWAAPRAAEVLRVADLGTGSGCLLVALLSELPRAFGVGVDISPATLAVARGNAARHGMAARAHFVAGSWGKALTPGFDLIVCNPPYVATAERDGLPADVREFEPGAALFAGADGEEAYRALAPDLARLLAPGGRAFVELGRGQGARVAALMAPHGLALCAHRADLAGIDRCAVFGHAEEVNSCPEING